MLVLLNEKHFKRATVIVIIIKEEHLLGSEIPEGDTAIVKVEDVPCRLF
jgi:hypothetical protein